MSLFGVVGERSGHSEPHVTVYALVRLLARVQAHMVLQGRLGSKLGPAVLARVRPLLQMFGALVVEQACKPR